MAKKGQPIRRDDANLYLALAHNARMRRRFAEARRHDIAAALIGRFAAINESQGALGDRRGANAGATNRSRHDDIAALEFMRKLAADDPKAEPYRFARLAAERFHPGADFDQRTAIIKRLVREMKKGRDR